jgi:hypothetical protein
MKTRVRILVCLLLALLLVPATAQAQTITCSANPGAQANPTIYNGLQTFSTDQTISNAVFRGTHSDDLVRVTNGANVTFDHVTFLGDGTGSTGHTLEVKTGGARATITNSVFDETAEGGPVEDFIQFQNHTHSVVECNVFGTPGEDAIDIKESTFGTGFGRVDVFQNDFNAINKWCTLANVGSKRVFFNDNDCAGGAYFRNDIHDAEIRNNNFDGPLWLDEVNDMWIDNNDFTSETVRYGANSTTPNGNFFKDNTFGSFDYRAGGCYRYSNTNPPTSLVNNCTGSFPPWW